MELKRYLTISLIGAVYLTGCVPSTQDLLRIKTEAYFSAWNNHDFRNSAFSEFKMDTSQVWHGEKTGAGSKSVFNPNSGWKQWDVAWNGTYSYEIDHIDTKDLFVTGQFHETTDFLKFIGIPEGFSATVTFWFNEDLRVKETFYDWSDDNQSMHEVIQPIVEWAKKNDSLRIHEIYLKNGFKPNKASAKEWKTLFQLYEERMD